MKRRSSYLRYDGYVKLKRKPVCIWAYGRTGKFVCRVDINGAGMSIYAGTKGTKRICDLSWETLVERLDPKAH